MSGKMHGLYKVDILASYLTKGIIIFILFPDLSYSENLAINT